MANKMYDYDVRMLSSEEREQEIAESKAEIVRIRSAVAEGGISAPDLAALRTARFSAMGKAGQKRRALELSPAELEKAVMDYFNSKTAIKVSDDGVVEGHVWLDRPTWSGLALHLGVNTKTLTTYQRTREEYRETLEMARTIMEEYLDHQLETNRA